MLKYRKDKSMESCTYNRNDICAYDLKDNSGYYDYDLVEEWKIAASKGKLLCADCGERVYLAAGAIKEPYFSHYDKLSCPYGNQIESEEIKKGKRLLYSLLKRSFPDKDIKVRYKLLNGMYSTYYISNSEGQAIAIDYRLQSGSIDNFNKRNDFYKNNKIIPIYISGIRKNNGSNQLSWYDNLLQKSAGLCIYLDAINEMAVMKKSFDYRLGNQRKVISVEKEYTLESLLIKEDGAFCCDFQDHCSRTEQYIQECKNTYWETIQSKKVYKKLNTNMSIDNKAIEKAGLRPDILNNAIKYLERGEGQLVSRKYLDYIIEHKLIDERYYR